MAAPARQLSRNAVSEAPSAFAADVIAGLSTDLKRLPPKYFYDSEGSRLFECITTLPEYYPTRTEIAILQAHAGDIAALIPAGAALIEFGAGSCRKTRIVFDAAPQLAAFVPVDISGEFLRQQSANLRKLYPQLPIHPVVADIGTPFALPRAVAGAPRVGFFPGSTIGNFEPPEACAFLRQAAAILGSGAIFVVGVDLIKDAVILNAAYNDAAGVTARFNLNLLAHINRALGADFDLDCFAHRAFYNRARNRIEMHLASLKRQKVKLCGATIAFRAGETIHTENSYKYSVESFGALARGAGWTPLAVWTDANNLFSVHALALA